MILLKRLKFIYTYVNKPSRKEQLRMIQESLEGVDLPANASDTPQTETAKGAETAKGTAHAKTVHFIKDKKKEED